MILKHLDRAFEILTCLGNRGELDQDIVEIALDVNGESLEACCQGSQYFHIGRL